MRRDVACNVFLSRTPSPADQYTACIRPSPDLDPYDRRCKWRERRNKLRLYDGMGARCKIKVYLLPTFPTYAAARQFENHNRDR